jgi:H+/Cl- antiporter ClcA
MYANVYKFHTVPLLRVYPSLTKSSISFSLPTYHHHHHHYHHRNEQDKWYFTIVAFLLFLALCLGFAALACGMTLLEPASAGSGIAEVRAYLNGIEYPRVMRLKTLWTKVAGVIFAQASGLPLGFEGPIIHCGAIVGSAFSQGRGPSLWGLDTSALLRFEDFQVGGREWICVEIRDV